MTKRSHQIASRQAAVSRERKRRKKSQVSEKHGAPSSVIPAAADATVSSSVASAAAVQTPVQNTAHRSVQTIQLDESRYQHVIRDLRKITIIAAPLIVILIILAFVL